MSRLEYRCCTIRGCEVIRLRRRPGILSCAVPCRGTCICFPQHSATFLLDVLLTLSWQVRLHYDDITAKSMFFPPVMQQSPPSQPATPSPPNTYIHPSPPHQSHRLIINESQTPAFRPPSGGRGTAAIKIIDPTTREERRRQFY